MTGTDSAVGQQWVVKGGYGAYRDSTQDIQACRTGGLQCSFSDKSDKKT